MWRRLEGCFAGNNECREKQAATKQTFVFHKPLRNESSVKAGSGACKRGIRESMRYIRRILAKKDLFCSVAFCQVCDTNSHAAHVQTVYLRPDAILTKQVFFLKWMLLMYLIVA